MILVPLLLILAGGVVAAATGEIFLAIVAAMALTLVGVQGHRIERRRARNEEYERRQRMREVAWNNADRARRR